jgi:hypothetical protein
MISLRACTSFILFVFTGLFLLLPAPFCPAEVLVNKGQLTVQVNDMPLSTILQEIGRQANIDIRGGEIIAAQRMTIRFGPLPLEKGLRRIMRKINYLTTFDHDGNILHLTICDPAGTPASGIVLHLREPTNPPTVEPAETLQPDKPENNSEVVDSEKAGKDSEKSMAENQDRTDPAPSKESPPKKADSKTP